MSQASHRSAQGDELQRVYWREKLAGRPPAPELPMPRARPPQPTAARARLAFKPAPATLRALRAASQEAGPSPFDGLLAAWCAFLYRTTRQGDLLIGLCEGERHSALRTTLRGTT